MAERTETILGKTRAALIRRGFSFRERGKRLFDIVVAGLGLIFLAPVFGLVALWIKRGSPGPVYYHGRRAAKGGGEFSILKFRTMYEDERSYAGPKVTGEGDPRITPVGKWLRDTKLNELPQLWNVIKGDMSLVGPRPEDPEIAAGWPEAVRDEILSVRPGVSSPASILYRDEENMLGGERLMETYLHTIAPNKQRMDQLYVRYHTPMLDLDVLLWTFLVLIPRVKRYKPPETQIFVGPFSIFARRYMSWFTIDTLTTLAAFAVTGLIWRSIQSLQVGWSKSIVFAIGFALIFSFTCVLLDTNRIEWKNANTGDVLYLLPAVGAATLVVLGINWGLSELPDQTVVEQTVKEGLRAYGIIWGAEYFPNSLIVNASILAMIGFVVVRYRSRLITGFLSRLLRNNTAVQAASERVLIIGGGQGGQFAVWWLNNSEETKLFHPVGFVDDDLYKQGARIRGVDVVGGRRDIPNLVQKMDVGIIIFAIHRISDCDRKSLLEICQATQAQIVMLPDFLGSLNRARTVNGDGDGVKVEAGALWVPDGIPAEQIDDWLCQIDAMVEEGDVEAVRKYIGEVRGKIGG